MTDPDPITIAATVAWTAAALTVAAVTLVAVVAQAYAGAGLWLGFGGVALWASGDALTDRWAR